jgi:hypothetical protein
MCLNEAHSRSLNTNIFVRCIPYSEWSEIIGFFIAVALEYAIRRPKKMKGTGIEWNHQLLFFAGDVNLLGKNVDTKKNIEALLEASREAALKVNPEKKKYEGVTKNFRTGRLELVLQMV